MQPMLCNPPRRAQALRKAVHLLQMHRLMAAAPRKKKTSMIGLAQAQTAQTTRREQENT